MASHLGGSNDAAAGPYNYFGSGGYAADDFFGLDANQPMEPPATAGVMNVVSFVSLHCYYSSHVCMQMECLI